MAYEVTVSRLARRDLKRIVLFISEDSVARARSFSQFLASEAKRLAEFPDLGREVPELEDPEIREMIVRNYRVIYRVDHAGRRVEIIRYWHAARGAPRLDEP